MRPYYDHAGITIYCGDCREVLRELPSESINCIVTSPPYWGLRDYGIDGQIGLEATPDEYVSGLVGIMAECKRVLHEDGTLWLNLGDSYFSSTKGSGGPSEKQLSNAGSRYEPRKFSDSTARLRLRTDLAPDQVAYVLDELAKHSRMASATVEGDE